MGLRMVNNLLEKGTKLRVHDIDPSVTSNLNATVCKSPKEVAEGSSVVITMLPNGKIVQDALTCEDGVLKSMKKGSLLVDCSTIAPATSQELAKIAAEKGVKFLDAPVSGGVTGAQAGTLAFMVGGSKEDVKRVEPLLLHMGSKVIHCGDHGAGEVMKLCNNLILGITMIGTCEGMNLGMKMGLDPKLMASVINISTGRSWSSDTYNPIPGVMPNVPSSNDYKGGFAVQLIAKDLSLASEVATQCNASIPLASISNQIFRVMGENGMKEKDFSAVYKFLKGQS